MSKALKIKLPKGFMNVAITTSNNLIADTNDSTNWNDLSFPLPKGQWKIKSIKDTMVTIERN